VPKPDQTRREVIAMDPSENVIITQPTHQNFYRDRDLNIESFDSNHNVILPTRVKAVDPLDVGLIAFGPNHMLCFGMEREREDSSLIIGRTLHEAQYDQLVAQETDLALTPKPSTEAVSADKLERENTALCQADFLRSYNLDANETKIVHDVCSVDRESADLLGSSKAAGNGVSLDEVTQCMGNTSLSSANTTAAAATVEGEYVASQQECMQVDGAQPILELDAETRKKETKRPGAIRRLSNRLLRRRPQRRKHS
jgi:hypothetical protein